jgi:sterol desaturase/sphingolipid hydroxylase (fatty acid hydroxylase superfamily)
MEFLQVFEVEIRLGSFLVLMVVMLLWEQFRPRRPPSISRLRRRLNNISLVGIGAAIIYVSFPIASVGAAQLADARDWGLFRTISAPDWFVICASFVILEFAIYVQHVTFHKVPWLWRLHRVHHSDGDFDTTTGIRFHPLELMISMLFKMTIIVLIGAPVAAVILFEVLLNGTALFNHGNVSLPPRLERWARLVFVTPDVHRVHHSVLIQETNSNYGFFLTWWDRLVGTFTSQPRDGHDGMHIGLKQFSPEQTVPVGALLLQPFRRN